MHASSLNPWLIISLPRARARMMAGTRTHDGAAVPLGHAGAPLLLDRGRVLSALVTPQPKASRHFASTGAQRLTARSQRPDAALPLPSTTLHLATRAAGA